MVFNKYKKPSNNSKKFKMLKSFYKGGGDKRVFIENRYFILFVER